MTFVVAAGNEKDDACRFSLARLSWSITVGSTDRRDQMSESPRHHFVHATLGNYTSACQRVAVQDVFLVPSRIQTQNG